MFFYAFELLSFLSLSASLCLFSLYRTQLVVDNNVLAKAHDDLQTISLSLNQENQTLLQRLETIDAEKEEEIKQLQTQR
jgi:hypothetical protein